MLQIMPVCVSCLTDCTGLSQFDVNMAVLVTGPCRPALQTAFIRDLGVAQVIEQVKQ